MTRMPADIINHSESGQKDFQAQRNPLAEQAEHSQRKGDIRSHRYGQTTLGRSSRRHEIIDQHRNQHTAARRHDGQKHCRKLDNSPTSISRFISSPTLKKKTAIKASLIKVIKVM